MVELYICVVSVYGMFKENLERQLLLLFLCHFHFPFEDHFAVVVGKTVKERFSGRSWLNNESMMAYFMLSYCCLLNVYFSGITLDL